MSGWWSRAGRRSRPVAGSGPGLGCGHRCAGLATPRPGGMWIDNENSWCHNGTMKRMNLRDVPDDVYEVLAEAAQANRQSLSAFVVERLTEVARVAKLDDYIASCQPPTGSGVTLEDAAAAVRQVREAS